MGIKRLGSSSLREIKTFIAALILVASASFGSASAAETLGEVKELEPVKNGSERILACGDFENVLRFIQEQHLRFDGSSAEMVASFVQSAEQGFPAALRILGYPMLAAYSELKMVPAWSTDFANSSTAQICQKLGNSLFRSAFLKAYARSLDPYSDFYVTDVLSAKASALEGEFIGVGIGTESDGDLLKVTEVVEGGPSEGQLFVGDHIAKIDGHAVKGLTDIEIRQRIRGAQGSHVGFEGIRALKNEKFTVTIIRDRVHQKSVSYSWMDNKVLSIRLSRFFRQTADEVEEVVKKQGPEARGFILDLRNNPGGLLQAARDVVDLFVSQGVVVYLKGKSFEDQIWALHEGGETKKPLVVLVNEGTASAAEIVAGALQDYGRAIVIGQKTYGKGSVQNIYETQTALGIHYKGGLKLTTLWYFLPSGRNVRALQPDLLLTAATDDSEKTKIDHPVMPYHGPDRIDVLPVQSLRSPKKVIEQMKASVLLNGKAPTEEVGREVLLKMLAAR